MTDDRIQPAIDLMARFAERTAEGKRYLWTDAFAVTNYLGLALATRDRHFIDTARALIDQVHWVLGRHRAGAARRGWLSGRSESDGAAHPTAGGLRIGKPLDERPPQEAPNERTEWDRDGQYFHYLTKWMHALDQTARVTGDLWYNCWARELADRAHRAFVYELLDHSRRMYWKMSIDLSRPLVPSMGQHDPLDGYVTCIQLEDTLRPADSCDAPPLDGAIADFATMLDPDRLATDDALGIGGLLVDAYRLVQLRGQDDVIEASLEAALAGLDEYAGWNLQTPLHARRRLAFRELGLAIGLAAVERMSAVVEPRLRPLISELGRFTPLRSALERFWLQPDSQQVETWQEHADINTVMLATSLVPDGFLTLHRQPGTPGVSFLNPESQRGPRQPSHSG
ncbi:MAG TPA: hypothetical protein VG454_07565 [Gemmatimonadales bacterium]|nr:hypothetical protein [Gemmatimonadales bacterium]